MNADQVARSAGVEPSFVGRLTSLGILRPGEDGAFNDADAFRIRLMASCDRAGIPLDAIADAIEAGKFSLSYMDMPHYRWAPHSELTFAEGAERGGIDVEHLLSAEEAQGSERPRPEDRARQDVLDMIPLLKHTLDSGLPAEVVMRIFRSFSESMRRIAEAEGYVYHHFIELPLLAAGMDFTQVTELAGTFGAEAIPMQEASIIRMYRRHQELVWNADAILHMETALEEMGLYVKPERPPAMVFLDLSGFTRITAEGGDDVAADMAGRLGDLALRSSNPHGGRPVKWLGDGVMFWFPSAESAVAAAGELVRTVTDAGLPPAHVGVAAGPVIAQDGDYYGRTVNLAARLAGQAAPEQILVDDEVVRLAGGTTRFEHVGSAELKGIPHPVEVHEVASRP